MLAIDSTESKDLPVRLVFFDLETGGFDSSKHPIIQIAAVAVDERLEILEEFERKVQFDVSTADPQALLKNSYVREVWEREAILDTYVARDFSYFLKEYADVQMTSKSKGSTYYVAQLIGHNADKFDGPFLQEWFKQRKQFLSASPAVLCTYQRAMHHFHEHPSIGQPASYKLADLCRFYGIQLDNAHDALADCRANLALYRALRRDADVLAAQ